jgi:amidase
MDYSIVVLPVTKADKIIDRTDPDHKPLNEQDKLNWDACKYPSLNFVVQTDDLLLDDPEIYDGGPVGI